jgi:3'(2'), 5'-bisphosphate nucleotidase
VRYPVAVRSPCSPRAPGSEALLAQVVAAVARACDAGTAPPSADAVLAALDRGTADADVTATAPPTASRLRQRWVLDPIDGTKGFLRGGDAQYAVGLALLEEGEDAPLLGVLALPNWVLPPASATSRGVLLAACRGGGAWVRTLAAPGAWARARADDVATLRDATVCISDHEVWASTPMAAAAAPVVPVALLPLCCGSLVKYAAVALGHASLFVQHPVPGVYRLKSWDHAAGVACVLGAGGSVVDFAGRPVALGGGREFIPDGRGVLVCGGAAALRAAALALLPRTPRTPLLALLDRDGTINADLGTWIMRPELLTLLPGAAAAVRSLNDAGVTAAVITNQSCVGRGARAALLVRPCRCERRHARRAGAAGGRRVDAMFVAPDHQEESDDGTSVSARRKPGPGMLLEALALYGVPAARAVMVGDTLSDMRAAAAAGVPRVLLCTGHGAKFAAAAARAGVPLPARVCDDGGALAALLPREALPLTLHTDLASATRALLAGGTMTPL